MQNLLTHKKWILFITLLIVLGMATPVLADYLGPNRTVTTTVSVCKFVLYRCAQQNNGNWDYKSVESWLCSNESKPWEAYSTNSPPCSITNDGHKYYEQRDSTETITITHPPATINGSLQNCTLSNGWCGVTAPELVLSANEPLAGYNITLIEGTLNSVSFACPSGASNCTLPMNQGDNTFNYWALSSWGDSSLMGTSSARVDTVPPDVSLSVTGTAGKNGWYKSAVQVAATASDATSGVATFEVSVNGGGYQAYTDTTPIPFSDNALHTLQFRTMDNAGNLFETAVQNFYVDTIPPTVNLPASWQLGRNVPYDVIDEGSGLGALRIVIEDEDEKYAKVAWDQQVSGHTYSQDIDWNGEFKDGTIAPPGTYLVWLKASDVAGNEKFYLGKVIVPEPNYVGPSVLPTEAPVVAVEPPAPPAELTQPEDTTSLAPSTSAETTPTTLHFTLTSGTASGAAASTTSPGILWGAAAAAAISAATAYALDATRKRKEAEAEQAARVKAEVARSKAERAEKQQKQQENYNKQQTLAQAILAYQQKEQQKKEQQAAYNAHMEEKMAKRDQQDESNWVAAQATIKAKQEEKKKAEEAAAKQAAMLAGLPGFSSERQAVVHNPRPPKPKGLPGADFAAQIVKGVQDFSAQVVTAVQDFSVKTINWVNQKSEDVKQWAQTKYEEAKESVNQKWEDAKHQYKVIKKGLNQAWQNLTAPPIVREAAYQFFKTLPSAEFLDDRKTIPIFQIPTGRLISFGLVESKDASTDANSYVTINKDGYSMGSSLKNVSAELEINTSEISLTGRVASPVTLEKEDDTANLGYSTIVGLQYNHIYDATFSLDLNFIDLGVETPDVGKGNARTGVYVEMNAWVATAVVVTAVVLLLTPIDEILATLGLIGVGISTGIATGIDKVQKVIEMLKGFQPIPPTLIPK